MRTNRTSGVVCVGAACAVWSACGDDPQTMTGAGGGTVSATSTVGTGGATGTDAASTSGVGGGGSGGAGGDGGSGGAGGDGGSGGALLPGTNPIALAADATHVYWLDGGCQGNDGAVMKMPVEGGAPVVVAGGFRGGWDFRFIALDASNVYWSGGRAIRQVAVDGGAVITVAEVQSPHGVGALAVDATSVYWVDHEEGPENATLRKSPIGGGLSVALAAGLDVTSLAVLGANVFWTNRENGTVMRIDVGGGRPSVVAKAQSHPSVLGVNATHLVWGVDGALIAAAHDGSGAAPLVSGWTADEFTLDATSAYWTANGAVLRVSVEGSPPMRVASTDGSVAGLAVDAARIHWGKRAGSFNDPCLPDGGIESAPLDMAVPADVPEVVPPNYAYPQAMTIDAESVYWVDSVQGTVMKEGLAGGMPVELASEQSPGSIAVDATDVYWTNGATGTVMKVSKSGGVPVDVAFGQTRPMAVTVNATNVLWLNERSVMAAPITGGPAVKLASVPWDTFCGPSPAALAATATDVYWINVDAGSCAPTVFTVALSGGSSAPAVGGQIHPGWLITPVSPQVFAIDATHAYWWRSAQGEMTKLGLGGGTPETIAAAEPISAITSDGTTLYWTRVGNGPLNLMKAPLAGGTATLVAGLAADDVYTSIAVDGTTAYWMRPGTLVATVVRVPK